MFELDHPQQLCIKLELYNSATKIKDQLANIPYRKKMKYMRRQLLKRKWNTLDVSYSNKSETHETSVTQTKMKLKSKFNKEI